MSITDFVSLSFKTIKSPETRNDPTMQNWQVLQDKNAIVNQQQMNNFNI